LAARISKNLRFLKDRKLKIKDSSNPNEKGVKIQYPPVERIVLILTIITTLAQLVELGLEILDHVNETQTTSIKI
jgi:hypothetical protein